MVNAIPSSPSPSPAAGGTVTSLLSLDMAAADGAIGAAAGAKAPETFDFASILGLAALPDPATAPIPAADPVAAILPASGKPAGKELPPALPDLAETPETAPAPADEAPSDKPGQPAIDLVPTLLAWTAPVILPSAVPAEAAPPVTSQSRSATAPAAPLVTAEGAQKVAQAPVSPVIAAAPALDPAKPAAAAETPLPTAQAGDAASEAPPAVATITLPRVAITLSEPAAPPIAAMLAARTAAPAAAQSAPPVEAAAAETTAPAPSSPASATAAAPGRQSSAEQGRQDAPGREAGQAAPEALATARPAQPAFAADIAAIATAQTFTAPVADRPVTAPATAIAAPAQDLASLVERLVAARDAAAPQAVDASVAHGEFGRVGLRFVQDSGALVVSMTSADPGFAPAVQAAAASVPSGLMQDSASGSQRDARGDGNAQNQSANAQQGQSASAGSGQSQAQAQAQQQTARRSETVSSAPARAGSDEGDAPSAGTRADGGIYA